MTGTAGSTASGADVATPAAGGASATATPAVTTSPASTSNDPYVQRREARKEAKQEYKARVKEAKQDYKAAKKEANAQLKSAKTTPPDQRNVDGADTQYSSGSSK
jgi:hypothetical protein